MKTPFVIMMLAVLSAGIISCRKDQPAGFAVAGTLYRECGVPISGSEVRLTQPPGSNRQLDLATQTDASGNFRFEYSGGNGQPLIISHNGQELLTGIPPSRDQSDLKALIKASAGVHLVLRTSGNYQDTDTLFYPDLVNKNGAYLSLAGPFTDGQVISSVDNFDILPPLSREGMGETIILRYHTSREPGVFRDVEMRLSACSGSTEVELTLP